jgi:hypothetical protein
MKYIKGNLWNFHSGAPVCITTNGIIKKNGELVMGAGIALQAKQRFPALPLKAGNAVKGYGNRTLYFIEERLFTFPTKYDWRDPSDINLIGLSAHQLKAQCDQLGFNRVYLPRPGCSNGKLNWPDVDNVLRQILDDRFTIVSL